MSRFLYSSTGLLIGLTVSIFILSGCTGNDHAVTVAENSSPGIADASRAAFSPSPDTGGKGPRIVFETTTHDFGEQISGTDLTKTFSFTNEGDGVLIVENVRAG